MARNITDELIRARELYIYDGVTEIKQLAKETGLNRKTLSRYREIEGWEKLRAQAISHPVAIGQRLQAIIVKLMDEMDTKLEDGQIVSDLTLGRIERIMSALTKLDRNYDDKGAIILAFKKFISWLNRADRKDTIKLLNRDLPDYYRSLREEN